MPMPEGLLARHPNPIFVETGAYLGDGIAHALSLGFERVISVEIHPAYFRRCDVRFEGDPRVVLEFGDSARILRRVLDEHVDAPATVWLDGHFMNEGTGMGVSAFPLLDELRQIGEHQRASGLAHTVLIDDLRCLRSKTMPGLPSVDDVAGAAREHLGARIAYADGLEPDDVMVCSPGARPAANAPVASRS